MTTPIVSRAPWVRLAIVLATVIAALGWFALSAEFAKSMPESLHKGRGLIESLYLYLRFFTILTNIGVAALMSVTAWRLLRDRPLPAAAVFAAALDYILVVGVTYELMLRRLWSPAGLQFYTDMVMHDVVPVLMLVFWIAFAPRTPLRSPFRWLVFPTVYFAATLLAGRLGQGYPYGFIDADRLGYAGVLANAGVFLAFFYGLGLGIIALAHRLPKPSPQAGARWPSPAANKAPPT